MADEIQAEAPQPSPRRPADVSDFPDVRREKGSSWQPGAQTILSLRVLQLSGVWEAAYARVLRRCDEAQVPGQPYRSARKARKAA